MVIYVFGKGDRVAKTHGDQEACLCGREMEAIRGRVIWKGLRTGSETASIDGLCGLCYHWGDMYKDIRLEGQGQ